MKRSILFTMVALLMAASVPASDTAAAVFSRDWETPGDGLLTYDDVNQREWLDLSETNLEDFPFPPFESVLSELQTGGMFEGFEVAARDDVISLAASAGIEASTHDFSVNNYATDRLIGLLGVTWSNVDRLAAIGILSDTQSVTNVDVNIAGIFEVRPSPDFFQSAGVAFSATDDRIGRAGSTGVYLYRTIPEPSSWLLMLCCHCALALGVRK